jgi:putative endonuclease
MAEYAVYIMANRSGTLYIGVTNDLVRRVDEHRRGAIPGYTRRYHVTRLVHAEFYGDVYEAITREKRLKGWVRRRKVALIRASKPEWRDLTEAIL